MKRAVSKKQALFNSVISLLLCFVMLTGTTFAWFTDQVTSSGNIIQSGSLDIEMQWAESYVGANTVWNDAAGEDAKPVFDYQNWEPGYTEVRYIKVSNEGNLAFKWMMSMIPVGLVGKLAEVVEVRFDIVTDNPHFVAPTAENKVGSLQSAGILADVIKGEEIVVQGVLLPEGEEVADFYSGELIACVSLHMREDAGNEYQGENIGDAFNILLQATQYNYEYDSFDDNYDKESTYPHVVTDLELNANVNGFVDENNRLTKEIVLTHEPTGISAVVPVGTLVDAGVKELVLKIVEDDVDVNITLDTRVGYDVVIEGIAIGNDKPVVITMPKVLPSEQTGTQLYHAGRAMTRVYSIEDLSKKEGNNDTYGDKYIYDFNSGNVIFSLIHFSNVSAASTDIVSVLGETVSGEVIELPAEGEVTIPADEKTYILTWNSGDESKKNPLTETITHTWYNLNPGTYSKAAVKVEMGAKVVLNGVNIRTSASVDAIQIIPGENGYGTTTRIDIADGTINWVTGRSGIGFGGSWNQTDVYVEGYGNLYATALGWGCAAIGVSDQSDGDHHKMHFNVSHLRAIPMNNAAGIGAGGNSWRTLKLTEFNGSGLYQIYRGGNAASIGSGINSDRVGEIVFNDNVRVHCYPQPWTAYSRDLGAGIYAGICDGIYIGENATVSEAGIYVPGGREKSAEVIVEGFKPLEALSATVNESYEVQTAEGTFGGETFDLDLAKCKVNGENVSVTAVYGKARNGAEGVFYLQNAIASATVSVKPETVTAKAEFLYRVGNQNNVTKAQIATMLTGKANDGTNVTIDKHVGDAEYNGSKFTETGLVKVTVDGKEYFLEVVNAYNLTDLNERHGNARGKDWVLIKDLAYTYTDTVSISDMNWYGNGFTVDFSGFDGAYNEQFIIHADNVRFDNIQLVGPVYEYAYVFQGDATGDNIEYYRSLIEAGDGTEILNSFVSGTRTPVRVNSGTVTIENTTLSGGSVANLDVKGGTLNLNDVTTINQGGIHKTSDGTGVVGYGILMDNDVTSATINVNGLTSYNWLTEEDAAYMNDPSSRKYMPNIHSSIFAHESFSGVKAINFSIIYLNNLDTVKVTGMDAPLAASIANNDGRLWCDTADSVVVAPTYTPNAYDPTTPDYAIQNLATSKPTEIPHAYLNGDKVSVGIKSNGSYALNLKNILAVSGGVSPVVSSIAVNGTAISGDSYTFSTAGSHTVTYTVTDTGAYAVDGTVAETEQRTFTYSITVEVSVAEIKDAEMTSVYNNSAEKYMQIPATTSNEFTVDVPLLQGLKIVDNGNVVLAEDKVTLPDGWEVGKIEKLANIDYQVVITTNIKNQNGEFATLRIRVQYLDKTNATVETVDFQGQQTLVMHGTARRSKIDTNNASWANGPHIYYYYTGYNGKEVKIEDLYTKFNTGLTPRDVKSGGCFAEGTMITLADGTMKPVEQITHEDQLLAWDFHTGTYVATTASLIESSDVGEYRVINLKFADGTVVRVIDDHGFFDVEENDFVFIDEENVDSYIGHQFVEVGKNGTYEHVELVGYEVTVENVAYYTIQTVIYNNCIAEGMFTLTPPPEMLESDEWFDYFEIGEGMKYDEEKMQADIEKYGLYTYEEFAEYATYEQFIAFNGPYLKVLVGRGVLTYEQILEILEQYKQWMT